MARTVQRRQPVTPGRVDYTIDKLKGEDMKKYVAMGAASIYGLVPLMSSAGASTPTTLTGLSATQVLNVSLKAASAKHSATTVGSTKVLGVSLSENTTSGPSSGFGFETVNGHKGEVIYSKGIVYAKFDASLVNFNYGVTDNSVANKWISVTKGNKFYASLSSGITFPSVLQQMHPAGTLSLTAPTTIDGVSAIGIAGKINPTIAPLSGSETIYVSTTAPFLPVQVLVKESQSGVTANVVLTPKNWGIAVSVTAPKSFTPIAKTSLPR